MMEQLKGQRSKKEQKLKDKQKLLSKLFVNSTYDSLNEQNSLIVSPMFINLILKQLESLRQNKTNSKQVRQYKKKLIFQIMGYIQRRVQNSLLIWNYDKQQEFAVIDALVLQMLRLADDESDVCKFESFLKSLTYYYPIGLKNLTKLTQYLSRAFYLQEFKAIKLKLVISVIKRYYDTKKGLDQLPYPFFYLYGQHGMGIKTIARPITQPIKNQFSFVICFRLTQPFHPNRKRSPRLLRLKTNTEQLVIDIKQHIQIRNHALNKTITLPVVIEVKTNYRLVVSFMVTTTEIALNSRNFSLEPIVKKQSQREVQLLVFGQSFEGMLSSILFVNRKIQVDRHFLFAEFPLGIQKWSSLNKLKNKNIKILQKIIFAYLPFSVFEVRYKFYCYDIFRKLHGQLLENVLVFGEDCKQRDISTLGGINLVLPLFYLARFYNSQEYPNLLNQLFELIQIILIRTNSQSGRQYPSSQADLHYTSLGQQFPQQDSLVILGNHVSNLSSFFNPHTFTLLLNIFGKLNDDQKVEFVEQVLWNINISKFTHQQTTKSFYIFLIKIYQNNKSIALKSKSSSDIIYWIVQNFQRRQNKSLKIEENKLKITLSNIVYQMKQTRQDSECSVSCCLQHYLNQSVLNNYMDLSTANKISQRSQHLHYQWLQKILSIILQYKFIDDIQDAEQNIKTLLRFSMNKYSTCFYLLILRVIKRQLKILLSNTRNIETSRNIVKSMFSKCHILNFLQFLAQKTISLDLITEILYFFLYYFQFSDQVTEDKCLMIQFVGKTLKRLSPILNSPNPIISGVKKVRKGSAGFSASKEYVEHRGKGLSQFEQLNRKQAFGIDIMSQASNHSFLLNHSHMSFQTFLPLFYLTQNFLTGQISLQHITDSINTKFKQQQPFCFLKAYFQSLPSLSSLKLKMLRNIQKYMNMNGGNKVFLMKSCEFNQVLLCELITLKGHPAREKSKELRECITRIYSCFFDTFANEQDKHKFDIDILEFYSTLKNVVTTKGPQDPRQQENTQNLEQQRSPSVHQYNYVLFREVLSLFQRQFESYQTNNLYSSSHLNLQIQCVLIFISQLRGLKLTKGMDQMDQGSLQNFKTYFSNTIQSSIQAIFKNVKYNFMKQNNYSNSINEIFSNSSKILQYSPQLYQQKQFSTLTYNLIQASIQKLHTRPSRKFFHCEISLKLIGPSSQIGPIQNLNSFFDIQLSPVRQGQINFIFDMIVPKLTSHFWLLYGQNLESKKLEGQQKFQTEKDVILKAIIEKYLNDTTKKTVYVFQVIIDRWVNKIVELLQKLTDISKTKNEQDKCEEQNSLKQQIQSNLHILIQIYNMFAIQTISKNPGSQLNIIIDKATVLRMITYQISGFLISKFQVRQQNIETNELFRQSYMTLWRNIFQIINFSIRQSQVSKEDIQLDNYQSLSNRIQEKNIIKLFYIQLLRFFILDRESNQIVPIQRLKQFYKSHSQKQSDEWIYKLIFSTQFRQSITLNNQIQFIRNKISNLDTYILRKKYRRNRKGSRFSLGNTNTNISQRTIMSELQSVQGAVSEDGSQLRNKRKAELDKLLDRENILQQDTRAAYFYNQELTARKFHRIWQKLWKKMRIYHHPYGLWMAMRNDPNKFQYQLKHHEIKNFTYKIGRFTSQSGLKPILQAKIIEPWHINRTKFFQNIQQIECLTDMMRSFQQSKQKKKSTNNRSNDLTSMLNIWNQWWKISYNHNGNQTQKYKQEIFNVVWIKGNFKAEGKVTINKFDQIEFWYQGIRQKDSHLTFQKFILSYNKEIFKLWPIVFIRKISKRRYLMNYHALEIEFIDSLVVLLHFTDKNQSLFFTLIDRIRQEKIVSLGSRVKANKIQIFQNNWYQSDTSSSLVQKWKKLQISNLSYLIKLNIMASRSGLDLSQYPVVPWISHISHQKQPRIRDLTKTIGGLGSQQRKRALVQKFSSKDPFNPVPPFFYGTHYSSPGVVFNFLVRLYPFTDYLKNLQGGKFDLPDRLFSSLISSWKSTCNQVSDVRQLVPQFYYLPQAFLNLENLNFGYTQSLQKIHNVDLPPWAANNPYYFIIQFRQMIESQQASKHISDWIDLIFGYKQRGQQAQRNFNLYYYLTYEQYNDLEHEQDKVHKKSCQAQIVHFGQIPPQLFTRPHARRNSCKKSLLQVRLVTKYLLMNKLTEKPVGIQMDEQKKTMILIKRNIIEHYSLQKNPISLLKSYKFNLQKSISQLFYLFKRQSSHIVFFTDHPFFIISGFMNNQIRVYNKLYGKIQKEEIATGKVNWLHLNKEENLLLVGCQSGVMEVYEIQFDQAKISVEKVHEQVLGHPITHISERDGFTVVAFGNYCSVYKISRSLHYLSSPKLKRYKACVQFLRSFRNNLKVLRAQIVTCPLYSIIVIDNASIKTFSINGQFIKSQQCNAKNSMNILKDNQMNEYVYYLEEDRIVVMSTPDLRSICELQLGGQCLGAWEKGVFYYDKVCVVGW